MGLFKKRIDSIHEIEREIQEVNINLDNIYDDAVEYFTTIQAKELNKWRRKIKTTEEFRKLVERYFKGKRLKEKYQRIVFGH